MRKRVFFLSFLLSTYLCATMEAIDIVDFGEQGVLFDIEEENGMDLIDRKIKDLNTTKITNELIASIDGHFYPKTKFKESSIQKSEESEDLVLLDRDIVDPDGRILYKKGDSIPSIIPVGQKIEICFINGADDEKVLKEVLAAFGNCTYMVANADARVFKEKYKVQAFPINTQNEIYLNRFKVEALPTKITKIKNMLKKETLNIIEIKNRIKNEEI